MAAGLQRQDHSRITTDQLVRFHKNKFDEMPRKLSSTENPRSFKKYPSLVLAAKYVGSGHHAAVFVTKVRVWKFGALSSGLKRTTKNGNFRRTE